MGCSTRCLNILSRICVSPWKRLWENILYIARIKELQLFFFVMAWISGGASFVGDWLDMSVTFNIFITPFIICSFFLAIAAVDWIRKEKRKHFSIAHPNAVHLTSFGFLNEDPEPGAPSVLVDQPGNVIRIPPTQLRMPEVPLPQTLSPSEIREQIYRKTSPTTPVMSIRRHSDESTKIVKNTSKHQRRHSEPYKFLRRQQTPEQNTRVGVFLDEPQPGTSRSSECVIKIDTQADSKENIELPVKPDNLHCPFYNELYDANIATRDFGCVNLDPNLSSPEPHTTELQENLEGTSWTKQVPEVLEQQKVSSDTKLHMSSRSQPTIHVISHRHSIGSTKSSTKKKSKHTRLHSEPYNFLRQELSMENTEVATKSEECIIIIELPRDSASGVTSKEEYLRNLQRSTQEISSIQKRDIKLSSKVSQTEITATVHAQGSTSKLASISEGGDTTCDWKQIGHCESASSSTVAIKDEVSKKFEKEESTFGLDFSESSEIPISLRQSDILEETVLTPSEQSSTGAISKSHKSKLNKKSKKPKKNPETAV